MPRPAGVDYQFNTSGVAIGGDTRDLTLDQCPGIPNGRGCAGAGT